MRDINLESTVYPRFTTRAFATGIPTTLAGTPVLSVYEENNLTQITAGVSIAADYDSVAGLNQATIVATAANGYEAGKSYDLVITTGTVGGVSVIGEVVASFTVEDSAIGLNATARSNLELQYDTTGLTGGTFPANQDQLGGIANVGSAVHRPAASYTLTTGTQSANTYTATEALDGINHEHTDTAGALELYYEFNIGSGTPSSAQVTGYVNGGNDDIDVYGYDWVSVAWVQIGNMQGTGAAVNIVRSFDMFVNMVGTGANLGVVRVRFYKASGLTSATLAVDQIFTAFSQSASGYEVGRIWGNTSLSNTSTTPGVDGIATNPVSTIGAMKTLSASTNLNDFQLINGSSITLAANSDNESYFGDNWVLALGSQSCVNIQVEGAQVSGIGTASSGEMHFDGCDINTMSGQSIHGDFCGFSGTVTHTLAGDYNYHNCYSKVAGAGAPTFTKTAGQAVTVQYRNWAGGITISGLEAGDVVTVGGILGTVTLNGADASVEIRGSYKDLVNNLTGIPAVNIDGAILAADLADILVDTGTTIPATIVTVQNDLDIITGTAGALLDTTATSPQLVDDVLDEVNTGAAHNVVNSLGRQIRELRQTNVYSGGRIWIDTVNGTAGSVDYENGTVDVPVDNIADAVTLSASLGINRFEVAPGSTFTLASAVTNSTFNGDGWTLALGGQAVSGSIFKGAAISGICTGANPPEFQYGIINTVTLPPCQIREANLAATVTAGSAGNFYFDRCHSAVAGTGSPVFDFGASLGNTNLNFRGYSGGIQVENMGNAGIDSMSLEGDGQFIEGACTGGTVAIRGMFAISGITNLTLSKDDNSASIDTIEAQIGTAGAGLTDLGGMSTAMKAEVNVEALDVLVTDTFAELAAIPAATASLKDKITFICMLARNQLEQTATTATLRADNTTTAVGTSTVSDDATTATRGEWS